MLSLIQPWLHHADELRRVFLDAARHGIPSVNPTEFTAAVVAQTEPPELAGGRLMIQAGRAWRQLRTWGKRRERRVRAFRNHVLRTAHAPWYPPPRLSRHQGRELLTRQQALAVIAGLQDRPLITLVVAGGLESPAAKSVFAQYYGHWEMIVLEPAPCGRETSAASHAPAKPSNDPRVQTASVQGAGPVAALNAGLATASGQYLAFLREGHELSADALTWIAWRIQQQADLAWLYSDHDHVDHRGRRRHPFHKPDFSPEFLLANRFTDPLSVYHTAKIRDLGGFRGEEPAAARHDLALRLSESVTPEQIAHLPVILCHCHGRNTAEATPESRAAGEQVVQAALDRRGLDASVRQQAFHPGSFAIELRPSRHPSVDILLPTRNCFELIKNCIASVRAHTRYPNYRIVVIDNQSDCPSLRQYLQQEAERGLIVLPYDQPFNHSDMHNQAIRSLESDLFVLLNNDIEILSPNWLEQLVASLEFDPQVAGVGGLLTYPDGVVQHGGLILGLGGTAGHAHRLLPAAIPGYFGRLHSLQEFSGVTAAMALVRRDAFLSVGGFRSERYPTSFNDVDLWIRLRQAGYRCLYNPLVKATHFESMTRGRDPSERVYRARLQEDWTDVLKNDPFYNPNLTLEGEQLDGFRQLTAKDLLGLFDDGLKQAERGRSAVSNAGVSLRPQRRKAAGACVPIQST
jgi:glycosyltransferase involved in cell wall biosynthesis